MGQHGALEDLAVLDLTRVVAGSFCSSVPGDMGARIIKIENPKGGDDSRAYGPFYYRHCREPMRGVLA